MLKTTIIILTVLLNLYASGDKSVGVVTKTVNFVEIKNGDKWIALQTGKLIYPEDEIRTGVKSLALLKLSDNTMLTVRENSSLTFANISGSTQIQIAAGTVNFDGSKSVSDGFKISTPTITASVRGFTGQVIITPNSVKLVSESGSVTIENPREIPLTQLLPGNYAELDDSSHVKVQVITPELKKFMNQNKRVDLQIRLKEMIKLRKE